MRILYLTDKMRALKRELKVNKERDALTAHIIARSRELLDELHQIRRDRDPYQAEAPRTILKPSLSSNGAKDRYDDLFRYGGRLLPRGASRAGLIEMRLFREAKSISGHQTLQLMRRPYGGKHVRCHTPCLPKVPRGRARHSTATTRRADSLPAGGLETAI
ncbi:hypothetical protein RDABS01_031281 [Bienertia sinuspersici]